MKTLFVIMHIFISFPAFQVPGIDTNVSCHYDKVPFGEFCQELTKISGVSIFYNEEWTDQITVTIHTDSISVLSAVESAIQGTDLSVSIWHNSLVVLKGEPLISQLPDFETEKTVEETEEGLQALTESEERYMQGRKPGDAEVIQVGSTASGVGNARVNILGKVLGEETGEPVIGATMYIEELASGTVTDRNGFLSIVLRPGKYNAWFEFMGYESRHCVLEIFSSGNFTIELSRAVISIKEVVIYGERRIGVISRDPGLEKISPKAVKEIPTMLGERDIIRVSEMLPGIVSAGEGSAGLNVRGGSSDQNVFYINKIPVYNVSHLFGFFPAFNVDIVKDFSIYKGHVPVQFGGRLSSVFNIITRQGNRKRFGMHGGINPVAANLTIEGPLRQDVSSVLLSVRSSYSDWILNRINDPVIRTSSARFNDIAFSVNYDFTKTQVQLFGYNSYDLFRLSDINHYEYSNSGISLNLRHNFSTNIHGDFAVTGARYAFETVDMKEATSAFQHSYKIDHYEARLDVNHVTLSEHTLEYGAQFLWNGLDRGSVLPYGDESLIKPLKLGKERGAESSLYFSDMVDALPWLNVTLGARFSVFTPLGPQKVYTYQPESPPEMEYLEDSVIFSKNKPIRWYTSPELRAAINLATDANGSVKLAFNQMHQNIFMLTNTIIVAPNTQWKLADYYLKPTRGNQISLGIFRNFPEQGWETSIEMFYKTIKNFPEFKDGADFLDGSEIESLVLQGEQKSYGVELFVRSTGHKLSGWLAYTWSRSIAKIDGGEPWNSINEGEGYPTNYDIPHVLNALINYQLNRRLSVSSVVTYRTGRPVTYPLSVYFIEGIPFTNYSKRNEYNIPNYFRMDLSVTFEGNLKRNKLIHSSYVFSVYNLTGRRNPYSVYFISEEGLLKSYKYSVIGVPLVTITWIFKLGNYATE